MRPRVLVSDALNPPCGPALPATDDGATVSFKARDLFSSAHGRKQADVAKHLGRRWVVSGMWGSTLTACMHDASEGQGRGEGGGYVKKKHAR